MTIEVRPIAPGPQTEAAVQALNERCGDYFERITGLPSGPADGASFFIALPPDKGYDDKFTFGIFDGEHLIGCIDLIRGWPDERTAVIGLLLLDPAARGRGLGRRAVVIETNDVARPFWEHMGFRDSGQTRPHAAGSVRSTAHIFIKALQR